MRGTSVAETSTSRLGRRPRASVRIWSTAPPSSSRPIPSSSPCVRRGVRTTRVRGVASRRRCGRPPAPMTGDPHPVALGEDDPVADRPFHARDHHPAVAKTAQAGIPGSRLVIQPADDLHQVAEKECWDGSPPASMPAAHASAARVMLASRLTSIQSWPCRSLKRRKSMPRPSRSSWAAAASTPPAPGGGSR